MAQNSENILVTGASSDIGRAILNAYRSREDRENINLIATANNGSIEGPLSHWSCLSNIDLESEDGIRALAKEVTQRFVEPFSVIHCVGAFWHHCPIDLTPHETAKALILSHYLTLFGIANTLLPIARDVGGCRFITFSCNSVVFNYPEMAAFTSAKAAVECLTKCIANEWAKYGVIANTLALPTIQTEKVLKLGTEKPGCTSSNYIQPSELADLIIRMLNTDSIYENGNVIKLFKYDRSFYHEAFFERNPPFVLLDSIPTENSKL